MKQTFLLLLSLLGTMGMEYAQGKKTSNAEKTFGAPTYPIRREYRINLGKGNLLILDPVDARSLNAITNIDSLLQVFLVDMAPLHDSLSDPLSTKRIDYVIDTSGYKKIRIQQSRPGGSSFLLNEGILSILRLDQDTIFISGTVRGRHFLDKRGAFSDYRITLYLNQVSDLAGYIDGRLNLKIQEILVNLNSRWKPLFNGSYTYSLKTDSNLMLKRSGGPYFRNGSYLNFYISLNLQNYKNAFVPSLSLGIAIRLNNGLKTHDLGLYWEPQFLFTKSQLNNNLVTYHNDFITFFYKMGLTDKNITRHLFTFRPYYSLSYLYHQEGSFYDSHSFRLGLGKTDLLSGRVSLEPIIYFHDFFRGVTPGLKFVVRFI